MWSKYVFIYTFKSDSATLCQGAKSKLRHSAQITQNVYAVKLKFLLQSEQEPW